MPRKRGGRARRVARRVGRVFHRRGRAKIHGALPTALVADAAAQAILKPQGGGSQSVAQVVQSFIQNGDVGSFGVDLTDALENAIASGSVWTPLLEAAAAEYGAKKLKLRGKLMLSKHWSAF